MRTAALWIFGLFMACFVWAYMANTAMYGPASLTENVGVALGMSTPVFAITGGMASIVYLVTKNRAAALWIWTGLIIVAIVLLGIGALRMMRG